MSSKTMLGRSLHSQSSAIATSTPIPTDPGQYYQFFRLEDGENHLQNSGMESAKEAKLDVADHESPPNDG